MLVSHVGAYVLSLLILLAVALSAVILRARWRRAILLAVLCSLLAVAIGVGTWGWATEPGLPGLITYEGQDWWIDLSETGVYARGPNILCAGAQSLQHSFEWPLHQVGYVT